MAPIRPTSAVPAAAAISTALARLAADIADRLVALHAGLLAHLGAGVAACGHAARVHRLDPVGRGRACRRFRCVRSRPCRPACPAPRRRRRGSSRSASRRCRRPGRRRRCGRPRRAAWPRRSQGQGSLSLNIWISLSELNCDGVTCGAARAVAAHEPSPRRLWAGSGIAVGRCRRPPGGRRHQRPAPRSLAVPSREARSRQSALLPPSSGSSRRTLLLATSCQQRRGCSRCTRPVVSSETFGAASVPRDIDGRAQRQRTEVVRPHSRTQHQLGGQRQRAVHHHQRVRRCPPASRAASRCRRGTGRSATAQQRQPRSPTSRPSACAYRCRRPPALGRDMRPCVMPRAQLPVGAGQQLGRRAALPLHEQIARQAPADPGPGAGGAGLQPVLQRYRQWRAARWSTAPARRASSRSAADLAARACRARPACRSTVRLLQPQPRLQRCDRPRKAPPSSSWPSEMVSAASMRSSEGRSKRRSGRMRPSAAGRPGVGAACAGTPMAGRDRPATSARRAACRAADVRRQAEHEVGDVAGAADVGRCRSRHGEALAGSRRRRPRPGTTRWSRKSGRVPLIGASDVPTAWKLR